MPPYPTAPRVERTCPHCGTTFTAREREVSKGRAVFCCNVCRVLYKRQQVRTAPAELRCTHCGVIKPLAEFPLRAEQRGLPRSQCRACWNARSQAIRNRRLYGISEVSYARLFAEQGSRCAICGRDPEVRHLSVDHDHATGAVRGLLCRMCNIGIGAFREDPEVMCNAIAYLRQRKEEPGAA